MDGKTMALQLQRTLRISGKLQVLAAGLQGPRSRAFGEDSSQHSGLSGPSQQDSPTLLLQPALPLSDFCGMTREKVFFLAGCVIAVIKAL